MSSFVMQRARWLLPPPAVGSPDVIVYWMTREHRAQDNWALAAAVELACCPSLQRATEAVPLAPLEQFRPRSRRVGLFRSPSARPPASRRVAQANKCALPSVGPLPWSTP